MKITLIVGTRPQIIKTSKIVIEALKNTEIQLSIIHTGQHYDYEMSEIFFKEIGLPTPDYNINVGSGTHGYQTGQMLLNIESILEKIKPEGVIIPGDTNSALAAALASVKLLIPSFHIEAGARHNDLSYPEEVNRRVIDQCSQILFAPSKICHENLIKENVIGKIYNVGDTMYDVFLDFINYESNDIIKKMNLDIKKYILLTLHRPKNVDNLERLNNIMSCLNKYKEYKVIFPIHPRTSKNLLNLPNINLKNIILINPVNYSKMLCLLKNAKILITDSGGLQKEAFWCKTPCITISEKTPWIETIEAGANLLIGKNIEDLEINLHDTINKSTKNIKWEPNPYGSGKASEKILEIIIKEIQNKSISFNKKYS